MPYPVLSLLSEHCRCSQDAFKPSIQQTSTIFCANLAHCGTSTWLKIRPIYMYNVRRTWSEGSPANARAEGPRKSHNHTPYDRSREPCIVLVTEGTLLGHGLRTNRQPPRTSPHNDIVCVDGNPADLIPLILLLDNFLAS
jgi:hypothetical protein